MKTIPLSVTGKKYAGMYEAMVDDEWYDYLVKWPWSALIRRGSNTVYAVRNIGNHLLPMHRVVTNAPDGMEVDHADGNGLNNQSYNLRVCTHSENGMNNGIKSSNTSGVKGVDKYRNGKYRAQISVNHRQIHLGYFGTEEEAVDAYDKACLQYHGEYARPNRRENCNEGRN